MVTTTLPGRLAWLADDVDRFRHVADERLDVVLGHLRELGAHAAGAATRGGLLTVIADAVSEFDPEHVLLAVGGAAHANWQERRLVEQVEHRFALPVSAFVVDTERHSASADGPLLLCYDGPGDAAYAIRRAGRLFPGRRALVVTAWQLVIGMATFEFSSGDGGGQVSYAELDREMTAASRRMADEGVRIAGAAGLRGDPLAVRAAGPVWKAIAEVANRNAASTIVMGSRGLSRLGSMRLGSVSSAVVRRADRPTLIIRDAATGVHA